MLKELSQSLYVSKIHSTHDRLMLQAALAVAFFGFLRVSKFTVNSWKRKAMRRGRFLAKQDVLLAPYDLQLTIKYSKMDQLGKGSIITMGLTRSSLLSSPRHAILLKVLSCQASCSIIPLPVWQAAVSQKATVHPPFSVALDPFPNWSILEYLMTKATTSAGLYGTMALTPFAQQWFHCRQYQYPTKSEYNSSPR